MPVTELYAFNLIYENLLAALYGVALNINKSETFRIFRKVSYYLLYYVEYKGC